MKSLNNELVLVCKGGGGEGRDERGLSSNQRQVERESPGSFTAATVRARRGE